MSGRRSNKKHQDMLHDVLHDVEDFTQYGGRLTLRSYQVKVARAVLESVLSREGRSIVVMFPRQSGKNELQAQIEAYLLTLFAETDAEIVKVSPTWKPQSLNAMRRLERVLKRNVMIHKEWQKESGYIYRVGKARIFFLSGAPETNIVGATASTLLEVDEAQDVLTGKFDKDIAPMAASTNATRVFWGTAWTSRTLLARELRAARRAQRKDGVQRAFVLKGSDVAKEVPAYGRFIEEQVARLGRNHPMVKTQYFSEEITAEGGMFPEWRVKMMTLPLYPYSEQKNTALSRGAIEGQGSGKHPYSEQKNTALSRGAIEGQGSGRHALLIDVAGEDEGAVGDACSRWYEEGLKNPGRDATALTVVEVDVSTVADELIRKPTYRPVERRLWTGVKHTRLYAEIKALAERWQARQVVIDATGVGAGLASFLEKALPGRVTPFTFSAASKSQLGWDFLGIVDSGRWQESPAADEAARKHPHASPNPNALSTLFFQQLSFCQYEILPGPEKRMRWGVPDGTRDPATGEAVHDDLVVSAALSAVLDGQEWSLSPPTVIIPGRDPLLEMDEGF